MASNKKLLVLGMTVKIGKYLSFHNYNLVRKQDNYVKISARFLCLFFICNVSENVITTLALHGHHGQYGRHVQRLVEAELKTERGSVFWNQNLRIQRTYNYFVLEMKPKEQDAIKANVSV